MSAPSARLTSAESTELIARVEEEHDLLRYAVDGWSAWAVVRRAVQFALSYPFLQPAATLRASDRLALAMRDAAGLARLRPHRLAVKTYASGLVEKTPDGKLVDIWFDELIERAGGALKMEAVNNAAFLSRRARAARPSDFTTTLLDAGGGLLRRASGARSAREAALPIHAAWREALGGAVPFEVDWLAGQIAHFSAVRRVYRRVLARVRPAHLLVADPGEHALVAAARELGIRVVEIQHGFLSREHAGYSWRAYARPYRDRLPVPHELFLYGEHWRRELAELGFWGDALRVVGSSRLDRYRAAARAKPADAPVSVVLTTQGVEVQKLIGFVSEFLRDSEGRVDLRLSVKLHPVYDLDSAPYLRAWGDDARVAVHLGSEGPSTFELLSRADLHLSVASTCHYDAIGLGVPTVILPLLLHDKVLPLYEAGHAHLADTPRRIVEIASRCRAERVPAEVAEYYFRPGATANIARELGLES